MLSFDALFEKKVQFVSLLSLAFDTAAQAATT